MDFSWKKYYRTPSKKQEKIADKYNREGKVACFVFAGGMASRLNLFGAKGCLPVTPFKKKSFFQIFFERVKAFEKHFTTQVEVGIMLSSKNEKETRVFLQKKHYFSFPPSQITFFLQPDFVCLDDKGKKLSSKAPSGNGAAIFLLKKSKWLSFLQEKGVECVHFIPVDNPLIDPLDSALTGSLIENQWDVVISGVKRKKREENLGALFFEQDRLKIRDYMELSQRKQYLPVLSTGQYCLFLPWLISAIKKAKMPIHWVEKKLTRAGKQVRKGEMFFFDLFQNKGKVGVLCRNRRLFFSPFKREEEIKKMQRDFLKRDKALLEKISGKKGKGPYELGACFFYPSKKLIQRWRKKDLPEKGYIPY